MKVKAPQIDYLARGKKFCLFNIESKKAKTQRTIETLKQIEANAGGNLYGIDVIDAKTIKHMSPESVKLAELMSRKISLLDAISGLVIHVDQKIKNLF